MPRVMPIDGPRELTLAGAVQQRYSLRSNTLVHLSAVINAFETSWCYHYSFKPIMGID